jgi:hypothetical protein
MSDEGKRAQYVSEVEAPLVAISTESGILGLANAIQANLGGANDHFADLLEAENLELRNQVVDLALQILDLQLQLCPDERTKWLGFVR